MFSDLKNGHSRKALVPAGHSYRECQTPLEWHDVRSVHSHSIHAQCRLPDVLMVHLGGNNLGVMTLLDVVFQLKKGLESAAGRGQDARGYAAQAVSGGSRRPTPGPGGWARG